VQYSDQGGAHSLSADQVIVAVGRRPYSADLFAAECGVGLDERGFIQVDAQCRTGAEDVWAIGDCVRGPMLAHKGKEEGIAVADRIARSEQHVKVDVTLYKSGVFPFAASGRARAMQAAVCFFKILAARDTDSIL